MSVVCVEWISITNFYNKKKIQESFHTFSSYKILIILTWSGELTSCFNEKH